MTPISFDLKVGFKCNNDCIHCVVGDKRPTPDLSLSEIKTILDTKVPEGVTWVTFTGGEPTIRKDLPEILKYAKSKNYMTTIQTNGTGFANAEFLEACAPYCDQVLLAIHSSDRDTHNKIVKSNKVDSLGRSMYDLTMQGFLNLLQYPHIQIHTQTVISRWNVATLYDTYSLIQTALPGKYMHLTYPHSMGNARKNWKIVCPPFSEIKDYLAPVLRDFHAVLAVEAIPMCYLYPYQDNLDYNFDESILQGKKIRTGVDVSIPFIHKGGDSGFFDKDGFAKNYNMNDLSTKRKGPLCAQCAFNFRCAGVWMEYMEYYGKNLDLFPIKTDNSSILKSQSNPSIILRGPDPCLNTCLFCGGGANLQYEEKASWLTFKKEADYLISTKHPRDIEISGEPGQYPLLVKALTYLKNNKILNIVVSTHGRSLKDDSFVKELKEAGMTGCRIPLYGSTKEIHGKTVQNADAFEETIQGIKNCRNNGIDIIGNVLLNKYNVEDLTNIIDLYLSLCGEPVTVYVSPTGIAYQEHLEKNDWFLPMGQQKSSLKRLANDPKYDIMDLRFIDIPYCALEKFDDRVHNVSNIPDLGIHQINADLVSSNAKIPHYRIKTKFAECDFCCFKNKCDGIYNNEYKLFGATDLKAIREVP